MNRQSRGTQRQVYNQNVARVPGLYNEDARVEIEVLGSSEAFDFFNLTAVERSNCMNQHF